MSRRIVERCFIAMKAGEGRRYIDMFPDFTEMLMSAPGAIATRLLRNQAKADSFLVEMEFTSQASKDAFVADPRLKPWAEEFFKYVDNETIEYFDHVGGSVTTSGNGS